MKKIIAIVLLVMLIPALSNFRSIEATSGFTTTNISNSHGDSILPQMSVSGNDVYILWNDNETGKFGVFLAKSTDGGTNFGQSVDISKNIGSSVSPQFAVSGNDVYAVWQAKATGKYQIIFAKSSDGGATFGIPVNISDNSGDSSFPKIMTSGNNIYITWAFTVTNKDYDILFTKSSDGGATFSSPINISNSLGDTGLPQMAASGNNVYITWENNGLGNFDVFVAKSSDSGNTFSTPVNLSGNSKPSGAPQIVTSGNNVYVVWMDNTPGNYEIFLAKSTDNGSTFGVPVNVSNNQGDSGYPQMTASGNDVYVVWTDTISKNNYDVLFAKSSDGGTTFGTPVNISNNIGSSGWAQVSVSGNIYVIWEEDSATGNYDIFISKSTDGGVTFSAPNNISNTKDSSNFKQMVVSKDNIYVVWQDGLPNHNEIFFAKSTTFVPEFGTLSSLVLVAAILSILIISAKTIPRLKMTNL